MLQFHFHTPSEEQINGNNYSMVAHFVHKNAEGKLSVVAVLFKPGKENTTLAPIFTSLPAEGLPKQLTSFDPAAVLPVKRGYFKFLGSLTTPPCSDGVRWQVLKQPVELSKEQISAFKKLYAMNARPVSICTKAAGDFHFKWVAFFQFKNATYLHLKPATDLHSNQPQVFEIACSITRCLIAK